MIHFTPSLTPLEDRSCPTGTAVIVGHALYLTTDTWSDAVLVQDDGLGHVRATIRGPDGGVAYAQGAGIDAIFVHLRGNGDQLDFALTGPAVHPLALVVDAGWGGDKRVRVELPPVTGPGQITLDLRGSVGQGGVDAWTGSDGLSGVNVLNRMAEGNVKVHLPPADHPCIAQHPSAPPKPARG
ncbi:MAG: hypothetical protein JWO38_3048 [Gemmataceae bacterium]|nr:hypothetical protein [Gemmataceae bacterium]